MFLYFLNCCTWWFPCKKALAHDMPIRNNGKIIRITNYSGSKSDVIFNILIIFRFQGYRCKSAIAIFMHDGSLEIALTISLNNFSELK